jgi:hypothetical protein
MKKRLLALVTLLAATLNASNPTLFRDEDTGFVMEIPAGMNRTWNLTHFQNTLEAIAFQNEDFTDSVRGIAFVKIPLTEVLGEGSEGLYPIIFDQIHALAADLEDSAFTIETLPSLADEEYGSSRIRISYVDEEELGLTFDLHTFMMDTYAIIVLTVSQTEPTHSTDAFTYQVLSTARFIEE